YTAGIESLSTQKPLGPILANVGGSTFWEKEGDQTDYPRLSMDNNNGNWWPILDRYVEKVNYLKLKTLTIGYSCPERWLRKAYVKGVRVFFSGENLCTWTNYSGMDPETVDINTGIDDGKNYPLARKLTFGVTINL
ncbi:MAG: SusC/RagA family TonB-linked outer membrane protein, partial [Odoribacter sp.]